MRCARPLRPVMCMLSLGAWTACNAADAPRFEAYGAVPRQDEAFAVQIVQPPGLGTLDVTGSAAHARPAGIPCATCHGGGDGALARREGHPVALHADLSLAHGTLVCGSCHDPASPDRLRLSSGEHVPLTDYMRLCGQCHGPQFRDYEHGSHGGMKGHWDLRRGPRERNGCIGCHAAHAPAYPRVLPAAPPNDRFLEPKHEPGAVYEQRWQEDAP